MFPFFGINSSNSNKRTCTIWPRSICLYITQSRRTLIACYLAFAVVIAFLTVQGYVYLTTCPRYCFRDC